MLNQKSISEGDIQKAKSLLTQFVVDFELYGIRNMSYNLHLLLHLDSVVEALGPAYVTSCFRLEDLNGKIRSFLIHGSRYAGSHLSSKLSLFLQLPHMIDSLRSGVVKECCKKVGKKMETA